AEVMPSFSMFQHISTTTRLEIDGDSATARTILFNPMVMEHDGAERVFFIGLWYCDKLVRTSRGWRISSRREEKGWSYNAPAGMSP
ncbi:MAG: nuclear transport factor 2 family protein, partial [Sphingopyxis sp.]